MVLRCGRAAGGRDRLGKVRLYRREIVVLGADTGLKLSGVFGTCTVCLALDIVGYGVLCAWCLEASSRSVLSLRQGEEEEGAHTSEL